MKNRYKFKKGFSLIETIISISILLILLAVVINTILLIGKAYSSVKISNDINNSATSILERLTREIRWSVEADLVNSVFDSDSSILVLNTLDGEGNEIDTRFYIDENNLVIDQDLLGANVLNSNDIIIDRFFIKFIDLGVSKMIKIEINLRGQRGDKIKTETFYNSVIMRESY